MACVTSCSPGDARMSLKALSVGCPPVRLMGAFGLTPVSALLFLQGCDGAPPFASWHTESPGVTGPAETS